MTMRTVEQSEKGHSSMDLELWTHEGYFYTKFTIQANHMFRDVAMGWAAFQDPTDSKYNQFYVACGANFNENFPGKAIHLIENAYGSHGSQDGVFY